VGIYHAASRSYTFPIPVTADELAVKGKHGYETERHRKSGCTDSSR
jgi:hypothetical protein